MGTFSIWHWLIVLAVVLILFGGGGKISRMMGDFGRGLKSFKKNVREDNDDGAGDAEDGGDRQRIADDAGKAENSAAPGKKTTRAK